MLTESHSGLDNKIHPTFYERRAKVVKEVVD